MCVGGGGGGEVTEGIDLINTTEFSSFGFFNKGTIYQVSTLTLIVATTNHCCSREMHYYASGEVNQSIRPMDNCNSASLLCHVDDEEEEER